MLSSSSSTRIRLLIWYPSWAGCFTPNVHTNLVCYYWYYDAQHLVPQSHFVCSSTSYIKRLIILLLVINDDVVVDPFSYWGHLTERFSLHQNMVLCVIRVFDHGCWPVLNLCAQQKLANNNNALTLVLYILLEERGHTDLELWYRHYFCSWIVQTTTTT